MKFKQIKRYLNQEYSTILENLSSKSVNYLLKRDLASKAIRHRKEIRQESEYFLINYIKVLEYLKNDFGLTDLYMFPDDDGKYNISDMDTEIRDIKKTYKKYFKDKWYWRGKQRFSIKLTLQKWDILNQLMIVYPKVLDKLQDLSKENMYKDIFFLRELDKLKSVLYLKENFEFVKRELKKASE